MSLRDKIFPELNATSKLQKEFFSIERIRSFLLSLIQLCAILFFIDKFQIEKSSGISIIYPIIILSFILSCWVSIRFRPSILFLTSIVSIYFAFGIFSGSILIIGGLSLILCCHLPIKFWMRLILILCAGLAMIILRADLFYAPRAVLIIPFLGSMFMFRIIIYLYEIKHGTTPANYWQRLSYFFLFPNHCFLLFPIIDFKTYLKTYYSRPDTEIWQKGIRWMLRGVIHLLCYRIIYLYLLISPSEVTNLTTLLEYITCSYALILRLSGLFHFIAGLLCMFGFDLHPVFNNYLLSTSFVDMWRRINIYWREFIMKIFFYPIMFKLKKKIDSNLLPATMILVFIITWAMHNYQWFWIIGYFPFNSMDIIFWTVLGICITLNSIWIEKRIAKPKKQISTFISYPLNVLKMIGVFLFMSIMWSLWGSSSIEDWIYLLSKSQYFSSTEISIVLLIIISIIILGSGIQKMASIRFFKKTITILPYHTLSLTLPIITILIALTFNQLRSNLPKSFDHFISSISVNNINSNDLQSNERGYYKALIDGEGNTEKGPWEVNLKRPTKFSALDKIYIHTNGVLPRVFKPNSKICLENYTIETNSFGLRDKDYRKKPLPSTFRIALLGGSYEAGSGVNNFEMFEYLLEEKLNKKNTDSLYERYELFNFAEPGYHLIQHVELCNTKIFDFEPKAVIYVAHSGEEWRLQGFFSDLIQTGADLKYPFLKEIKRLSGAKQTMSEIEIKQRLSPYINSVIQWSYIQIAAACKKNYATPIWAYLPTTADSIDASEFEKIKEYASKLEFVILDLRTVYGDVDKKKIAVSEYDTHPNAIGHQLIFEKFYSEFIKNKNLIIRK